MMDMVDTVESFSDAIEVRRTAPAYYVEGRALHAKPTSTTISAVVQPATSRDTQRLPENLREVEAIAVWCEFALRGASVATGSPSDVIVWDGRNYEVKAVEPWKNLGNYVKAIATRVGQ